MNTQELNDENQYFDLTQSDFLYFIIELRHAYLENDLEKAQELLPIINTSYFKYALEKEIYDLITVPPEGYQTILINDTLYYIIMNLENFAYKDDLYLQYKIMDIIGKNAMNFSTIQEQLKELFRDYLNDKNKFISTLTVSAKIRILKACLTYYLTEEYQNFLNFIEEDSVFAELTKYKEKNNEQ